MSWAIYGATGHTGRKIAREAVARGEHPLLLGRNPVMLRDVADELTLPFRVVGGPAALTAAALDTELIVNAAGPFGATAQPVLDACIAGGAHYLDLSNELDPVRSVFAQGDRVREAGIAAVPAAGFGTVATDAAALAAVAALRSAGHDAARLEVAMLTQNEPGGSGTGASVVAVLAQGGVRLVDGVVQRSGLGRGAVSVELPVGRRTLVPVATGDIVTAAASTGIRTVSGSTAFAAPAAALRVALPALSALARRRILRSLPESRASEPFVSAAWARATAADGSSRSSWLTTGEGYAFTASSVVLAVLATLAAPPVGVTTVASAFGADFALGVPGTAIRPLD
ncbi:MAG: saccharopine dehydrogenase [Microbacteriaceae bacterium]|nr:saccharopine dehydrogenase [Microbacteriaceae bacterium]